MSYSQQSIAPLQGSSPQLQGSSPQLQGSSPQLQGSSPGLQRQGRLGNSFLQQMLGLGGQGQGQAAAPAVDLAQYEWLLGVYVGSGALSREDAAAMVQSATPAQLQAMMTPGEGAATPPGSALPEANMDMARNSRARPLNWDSTPAPGHISPEAADGQTNAGTATLSETFGLHRTQLMAEDFGEGVTLQQIRSAIALADSLGRGTVSGHLRARLFRINQYAVVETLNVEDSGRYQPGGGNTYCNIYAYDVVTALGAYIPRVWWTPNAIARIQAGEQVAVEYGQTVTELNANALNTWMRTWGAEFGWSQAASMTAAQDAANSGKVAIILAANANPRRSGHINVILAERGDHTAQRHPAAEDGTPGEVEVPLQSQAGASNFKYDDNSRGLNQDQWWENATHTDGAAWINSGSGQSSIITPSDLGRAPAQTPAP